MGWGWIFTFHYLDLDCLKINFLRVFWNKL